MRVTAVFLALSLALAPITVVAQDPAGSGPTPEQLFEEGRSFYETADYERAIEKWTKAYQMVGDDPGVAEIKTSLLYNIASAHENAYEIDADITHLHKARVLLERFDANIDHLYEPEAAAEEHKRAQERIAEIEAKIAEIEGDEPEPDPDPDPQPDPEPEPDPEPTPPAGKPHQPLIIGGAVVAGVGIGLGGLGLGAGIGAQAANNFSEEAQGGTDDALATRRDEIQFGQTMNVLTYVGYVGGGLLVLTGAVMLGVGLSRKAAQPSANARVVPVPTFGPGQVGVGLAGSF